jgi:hypothetical protein
MWLHNITIIYSLAIRRHKIVFSVTTQPLIRNYMAIEDEIILPNPDDFTPLSKDLASCTPEDIETIALNLLSNSHHFCNSFVPTQLKMIRDNISVLNKRLTKARSADDYTKLTSAMRNMLATYSQLIEQSTVVFMSSHRPLQTLLLQNRSKAIGGVPEDIEMITAVDTSGEIDTDSLSDSYQKYAD